MSAAVRGGSRAAAKPRGRAAANPAPARGGKGGRAQSAPAPGRARPSQVSGGLTPKQTLLAAAALLGAGLLIALGTGGRAEQLSLATNDAVDGVLGGMGYRLKAVHVQGASPMATADILAAAGLYKDQPVLGMDLKLLRERVAKVGWVKDVRVVRLLPDTLVIAVTERKTLAVWQHGGRSHVIDAEGQVIPEADPGRFPTLPLIVGDGANERAGEILASVAARPRLTDRLEALVRVDGRRWDLRMKDGSLVQLPAVDEEAALIQLEQLDQRSRILELGFERIDLRDPSVVAVRPRDGALPGQLVAGGA
jgi:cell division protein FtsQ